MCFPKEVEKPQQKVVKFHFQVTVIWYNLYGRSFFHTQMNMASVDHQGQHIPTFSSVIGWGWGDKCEFYVTFSLHFCSILVGPHLFFFFYICCHNYTILFSLCPSCHFLLFPYPFFCSFLPHFLPFYVQGGILHRIFSGGVLPGSPNPDPFLTQNM